MTLRFSDTSIQIEENVPLLSSQSTTTTSTTTSTTTTTTTTTTQQRPSLPSNPFSLLFFWPVSSLARVVHREELKQNHLWDLEPQNSAKAIGFELYAEWQRQVKKSSSPSLLKALFVHNLSFMLIFIATLFLLVVWILVTPVLIPFFIAYLEETNYGESWWWGWVYVACIVGSSVISSFVDNHLQLMAFQLSLRVMSGVQYLIFQKSLRISQSDLSPGETINLFSSDTQLLGVSIPVVLIGLAMPLELLLVIFLLWRQVGYVSLVPVGVLLLVMPIVGIFGQKMYSYFEESQLRKDDRIKVITEIFNSIRIVKYYAWEKVFKKKVGQARSKEIDSIRKMYNWAVLFYGTLLGSPDLSIALLFICYGLLYEPSMVMIFSSLNLLDHLRFTFLDLPSSLMELSQMLVNIERIEKFLLKQELPPFSVIQLEEGETSSMEIRNGNFSWKKLVVEKEEEEEQEQEQKQEEKKEVNFCLKDISLKVTPGNLTMVCGAVGSGKSTLCQALLGEVPQCGDSTIAVRGDVCYVPQIAWIQNSTFRENILFGKPYNDHLYKKVIYMSALLQDLEQMPAGDLTEIGEHGVNLSGGQKQRVSIARALYSEKDNYIFDDPLSAVDATVGKHIFEEAILNFLQNKCVLMTTNQLQFLPKSSTVIFLSSGSMAAQGTFQNLIDNHQFFRDLMHKHGVFSDTPNNEQQKKNDDHHKELKSKEDKLIQDEEKESGEVSWDVYWFLFKASGPWLFMAVLMAILQQGCSVASTWWLQFWAKDYTAHLHTSEERPVFYYVSVLTVLNLSASILVVFFLVAMTRMGIRMSQTLHKNLISNSIRAPIAFFDVTPVGRIISRFSTDMGYVDDDLMVIILNAIESFFELIGVLAGVAMGAPFILLLVPLFGFLFRYLQTYFQKLSIEIKRLESLSRAPLYSHFSETLAGVPMIRAYREQKHFISENLHRMHQHNCDWFALKYAYCWYGLFLAQLGNVLQLFSYSAIVIINLYFRDSIFYNPGLMIITITLAPAIVNALRESAHHFTVLETEINAVERIKQYTEMPQEAAAIIPHSRPPPNWPSMGVIEFHNFSMRYRPNTPLVLRGITVQIQAQEKIGIVGRTGAGKSSLVQALFRLTEADEGEILIDGVNIAHIGTEDLRKRISIIPQEPTLFTSTIRKNLDPFDKYEESELWNCLELANLKDFVQSLPNKLEEEVTEGGTNLSVGQRQLICMVRVLLQQPKILIMDEATASVDMETDRLVQKMIRVSFKDATLLVIAHRLNTVMDMEKILVLRKGQVIEFDSPAKLANNKNSSLYEMIQATGHHGTEHLLKMTNQSELLL